MNKVFFHEALEKTIEFIEENHSHFGKEPILLRDIYGRISVIVQTKKSNKHKKLAKKLFNLLGNFAYSEDSIFIYSEELIAIDSLIKSPDKILIQGISHPIYLLDRQITGQDWLRQPIEEAPHPPRVTLFGIKGGVGRSTALSIWSWYLAKQGKKVLVIDLDLESPGIGQILLPHERAADFGVVDWLVEEAVGQADEWLLRDMVATSPLSESTEGTVRVVSAAGGKEQDYIAKLSRVYMDINQDGRILDFAHRLSELLQKLETQEKPDIVLLDSRAGIHDIAAIAITRLTDMALLFAVNTPQTWQAYRFLFKHWQKWNVNLTAFRENLKIVAGMVPELSREDYFSRCRESAYNLFLETIYEESDPEDLDTFNYPLTDDTAPHFPLEIFWNITFQEFNPQSEEYFRSNSNQIIACYGNFLQTASRLALGEYFA
ncbi:MULTISPECIES: KGGVGR-motif variant AAA ATPase [Methylomicrobium]|uniref:CobQ/CobB/MinD/ParA nucleotide binding domain-containing protein n=1 Tax=Methylomicrobium album BG8 TaxID=686340 RepID=H8GQB6_METAL|nr:MULTISPECIES: ParA family protein [Methylomicrobium]EIC28575.1 CobQ/CobB/MinD/ParA nucleotide binding domain-containing protein [Methylomicrobium album BG8]